MKRCAASVNSICLLAALAVSRPLHAQIDDTGTASLLRDARENAAQGRFTEAIEQFQRIIDAAGDDLVPADERAWPRSRSVAGSAMIAAPKQLVGGRHRLPARWICHRELGELPHTALAMYRKRVDPLARKRLDEARSKNDWQGLQRLLSESFCATPVEDAIQLLAEHSFERGDFDSAEHYWCMLLPERIGAARFPRPKSDAAAIRARLVLLKLFQGKPEAAVAQLTEFQKEFPDARGLLAGRNGLYAETLRQLAAEPGSLALPKCNHDDLDWPTFAGQLSRNSAITNRVPQSWPERPTWRVPIPAELRKDASPNTARSLAFHPAIWNDRLLVNDAARIWAFDVLTGQALKLFHFDGHDSASFDLVRLHASTGLDLSLPTIADVRYTLTVADDCLYARLGAQILKGGEGPADGEAPRDVFSGIVCFGPAPSSPGKLMTRWLLRPAGPKDIAAIFEGTPVVRGNRLWVTTWRVAGGQEVTGIACYSGVGGAETPELLWQHDVAKVPHDPAEPRYRHEVLTVAGDQVICCTPGGTAIALDVRTGKPLWEFRYPRRQRKPEGVAGRELGPCIADGGRAFIAPPDADRVFCLDSFTGQPLWESRQMDVVHLLGVARNRLVCTLDRPLRGMIALDVATGSDRLPRGWIQHDDGTTSFGRGFVTDDAVFWPTRQGLQFLSTDDGSPLRQPLALRDQRGIAHPLGNLAFGRGALIAATPTEILGYISERRQEATTRETIQKPWWIR